jgi:hypothetical protein
VIPKHKLDDIWRSGFCRQAVEHAKRTTPDSAGSQARVAYLKAHIEDCVDCQCANILKNIESEVAAAMGAGFHTLFIKGGDITDFAEFRPLFEKIFRQHCESGSIRNGPVDVEAYMYWLQRMASRGPYPEHTKKKKGRRW